MVEIEVRPAEERDRLRLATVFAAVAEERDGRLSRRSMLNYALRHRDLKAGWSLLLRARSSVRSMWM
jgi:hypothetical protein